MATIPTIPDSATAEQFADRLMSAAATTFELFGIYLGDRLGYYNVLARRGPLSPADLASITRTNPRYVREWIEHQAVAGILQVEDVSAPQERRRFFLPADKAEVLADTDSLNYLAPLAQLAVGAIRPIDEVHRVFREGGGVPYEDYGVDLREGQGRMNRAAFLQLLGKEWIPAMPDVDERLKSSASPRVADFGCGLGWSSIGVATNYPRVRVDGFDLDGPSIESAKRNAEDFGVADRVHFEVRDAGDPKLEGLYDLVLALECVHDMSNPVAALRTMRRLARQDGAILVVDERVAHEFTPSVDATERLMYGFSILHCLPVGMADQPSAGTGTIMRAGTLKLYAKAAGFQDVEILPVENPLFRFYRLRP